MTSQGKLVGMALPLLVSLTSCGGIVSLSVIDPCDVLGFSGEQNPSFSAAGVMRAYPMANEAIASIVPLGSLNPPRQVYPTGHMYVIPRNADPGANTVIAPATGRVIRLDQPEGTDWKIIVQVDTSFYYFLNHVTPFTGVAIGSLVLAGQGIGRNSGLTGAVDFGVYNWNNPLTGIRNPCAAKSLKHVDSPLKYYPVAAQQALGAKIATSGAATKYGRIDYDESGKLVGNWVRTGSLPIIAPDETLAFAYNVSNHELRISMGSSLSGGGVYAVQSGAKDFKYVTKAMGQVNYRLFPTGSGDNYAPRAEFGVLAVQVLSDTRIMVELFPGDFTGTATFTAGALTYDR